MRQLLLHQQLRLEQCGLRHLFAEVGHRGEVHEVGEEGAKRLLATARQAGVEQGMDARDYALGGDRRRALARVTTLGYASGNIAPVPSGVALSSSTPTNPTSPSLTPVSRLTLPTPDAPTVDRPG
jgi:hypothetical protein